MTSSPRFTLSLVMGFTTLLAACGGGGEGSVFGRSRATGTVAVVLRAGETPMGREIVAGLQESAKAHGLELAVSASGGDPVREQSAVARAIANKVAALVVESVDSITAGANAAAAAKAGIPYFAIGVPAAGTAPVAAQVEVDHYAAGRVAAEYLAGYLGGQGVLALVRSPGAHGARELEQGFRDGVAAHGGLAVAAVVDAADQPAAAAGMLQLLRAQRAVKGAFAAAPALAQGAAEGAIAARRADLAIVSFEMSDQVRAAVANAQQAPIKAAVIGQPREIGKAMIDEVALQLADEPVAAAVKVPVRLVTADSTTQAP